MAGWRGSRRKFEFPPDWARRRAKVLQRAGYRCEHVRADTGTRCRERATEVDHVVPHSQGGSDELGNLQALCSWHHVRKSGREGAQGVRRARPAREHPGILP